MNQEFVSTSVLKSFEKKTARILAVDDEAVWRDLLVLELSVNIILWKLKIRKRK